MKCPECGFKHPAKQGMKCGKCGYLFTFDPKDSRSSGLTDGKFQQAIGKAGQNGTAFFTENQLYAAYAKLATENRNGKSKFIAGLVITGVGIAALFLMAVFALFFIFVGVALILSGLFGKRKAATHAFFLEGIQVWKAAGKPIPGLIEKPSLGTPPKDWPESDIYQYGVERILVVQRDLLVDLMIKNNQHTEHRMLVIAESGYPKYLIPRVKQLLDERQDLPVFLLHDATQSGRRMIARVKRLDWLPVGRHSLIDLGFVPEDYAKLKRAEPVRAGYLGNEMPADALMLGAITLALGACFSNRSVIADEIAREAVNAANSNSSFG